MEPLFPGIVKEDKEIKFLSDNTEANDAFVEEIQQAINKMTITGPQLKALDESFLECMEEDISALDPSAQTAPTADEINEISAKNFCQSKYIPLMLSKLSETSKWFNLPRDLCTYLEDTLEASLNCVDAWARRTEAVMTLNDWECIASIFVKHMCGRDPLRSHLARTESRLSSTIDSAKEV